MSAAETILGVIDPRGRLSRKGLLAVAGWLLAADVAVALLLWLTGVSFTGPAAFSFKFVTVWIATVAVAKRLHDLDLSAWWIAKAMAAFIGWSIVVSCLLLTTFNAADAVNPHHMAFWLNVTATCTPVLAAILWVHVAKGTPGANRYGPEPGVGAFDEADSAAMPASGRQLA